MWFLRQTLTGGTCASSERAVRQWDAGLQRWAYQNRICYQSASYEAEEMWSPRCTAPNRCARDTKPAEWKIMCVHALQHSSTALQKAAMWSLPHFKHKHHQNMLLKSCVCGDWTDSRGLLLSENMKTYAEALAENNADLTDRFSLPCNKIRTWCIYTAEPLENLIKSAQIGNESSWYVPPFTSSHYSVCVCAF